MTGKVDNVAVAADSHQTMIVSTRARRQQQQQLLMMDEAIVSVSRNSTEGDSNISECTQRDVSDTLSSAGSSQILDINIMRNKVGRQCLESSLCSGEEAGVAKEREKVQKRLRRNSDGVSANDTKSSSGQRPKRVISAKKLVRSWSIFTAIKSCSETSAHFESHVDLRTFSLLLTTSCLLNVCLSRGHGMGKDIFESVILLFIAI